ncbi:Hypothetical predicted protein [Paramuricea clavata]|uniref:Uncharacterized protein n=1 Tax=Paramuricea clavata TaxID=317549 RepID=A0A6S7GJF9_PARCT|nr:Hypothetical predicted protein [Paramuricea clavata]
MEGFDAAKILVNMSRASVCEEVNGNDSSCEFRVANERDVERVRNEVRVESDGNVPLIPVVRPLVFPFWGSMALPVPQQLLVEPVVPAPLTGVSPLLVWPEIVSRRRTRHRFSGVELEILEGEFSSGLRYPSVADRL